ncbi:hypothetical protein T07_8371 [Trichinella nelsoni]|uniref:Uncharacterized protein n=1 Tax=Trichinella nelsoni TaxID=6336 RepID=A0A0V0RV44_9BILA|nr:hypothetical protein T07_8371 [Trichinella nelsoni]
MINGRGQIMLTVVTLLANKCRGLFCFADSAGRCFSGKFRQWFTSTSVECCLPSAAFIQACLVLLGMSRSDGHLGWVPFFSVPTTHGGSSRWRTYYIKAEVRLQGETLVMRTVAPCDWCSRSIDKLDIDRQSCESDLQCRK